MITQATEHPAVLATVDALRRLHGFRITVLPVDQHGLVNPDDLAAALTDDTVLVSIMHANGETGTIQPIHELADLAHARGALFHTDASQTVGKIPVSIRELGIDLLTVTGHKDIRPQRRRRLIRPQRTQGRTHRLRRRPRRRPALRHRKRRTHRRPRPHRRLVLEEPPASQRLRDLLHHQLTESLPGRVHLNGHPTRRLPNTLNLSITATTGRHLLAATPDIAASTGSACHEGIDHPSPVLTAIGLSADQARSALRLTLGRWTTHHDITRAATALTTAARATVVAAAQGASGVRPGASG